MKHAILGETDLKRTNFAWDKSVEPTANKRSSLANGLASVSQVLYPLWNEYEKKHSWPYFIET